MGWLPKATLLLYWEEGSSPRAVAALAPSPAPEADTLLAQANRGCGDSKPFLDSHVPPLPLS